MASSGGLIVFEIFSYRNKVVIKTVCKINIVEVSPGTLLSSGVRQHSGFMTSAENFIKNLPALLLVTSGSLYKLRVMSSLACSYYICELIFVFYIGLFIFITWTFNVPFVMFFLLIDFKIPLVSHAL